MGQIILTVRGNPLAQKRHRSGKGWNYDPSASDKGDFLSLVHSNAPENPIDVAIALDLTFYMPIPKSWPKYRKREVAEGKIIPHIKKPDTTNLTKFVEDALNGVFYTDDRLIYSITAQKFYSHIPRTVLKITWENMKQ